MYSINKYGATKILMVGQKVECIYYHEYGSYMKDAYKRSWLSKLIDEPFKPVKFGVIVGDAGTHPYWLASGGATEQYLLVKFKEYILPKPIPISCIKDAKLSAEFLEKFLKMHENRVGEKGFDKESREALTIQLNRAKQFLNS